MFVAFCDHVFGNSTSVCSNATLSPWPMRASRAPTRRLERMDAGLREQRPHAGAPPPYGGVDRLEGLWAVLHACLLHVFQLFAAVSRVTCSCSGGNSDASRTRGSETPGYACRLHLQPSAATRKLGGSPARLGAPVGPGGDIATIAPGVASAPRSPRAPRPSRTALAAAPPRARRARPRRAAASSPTAHQQASWPVPVVRAAGPSPARAIPPQIRGPHSAERAGAAAARGAPPGRLRGALRRAAPPSPAACSSGATGADPCTGAPSPAPTSGAVEPGVPGSAVVPAPPLLRRRARRRCRTRARAPRARPRWPA